DPKRNPNPLLPPTKKEKIKRNDLVKGSIIEASLPEKPLNLVQLLAKDKQELARQGRDREPQGLDKDLQTEDPDQNPELAAVHAPQEEGPIEDRDAERLCLPIRRVMTKPNGH